MIVPIPERDAYLEEVADFLASASTTRVQIDDGRNFHRTTPTTTATAPLIDHLEERLEIAVLVQNKIRHLKNPSKPALFGNQDLRQLRFELMHLAMFLFADIQHLRRSVHLSRVQLIDSIFCTEAFLAIFLQRKKLSKISPDPFNPTPTDDANDDDGDHTYQPNAQGNAMSVDRNDREREKAFARDNEACVFSCVVEAEVAHIWPYAINNTIGHLTNTRICLLTNLILMDSMTRACLELLFTGSGDELGTSDRTWNMITMSRNAHAYWGKAYFGLEWHDIVGTEKVVESGVKTEHTSFRVQWHWLPSKILDAVESQLITRQNEKLPPRRLVKLDTPDDIRSIANAISEATSRTLFRTQNTTLRDHAGHLIETGRLFTLKVDSRDLEKMKDVIDAQWLAIRMAAFSGAAEFAEDLNRTCPPGASLGVVREAANEEEEHNFRCSSK